MDISMRQLDQRHATVSALTKPIRLPRNGCQLRLASSRNPNSWKWLPATRSAFTQPKMVAKEMVTKRHLELSRNPYGCQENDYQLRVHVTHNELPAKSKLLLLSPSSATLLGSTHSQTARVSPISALLPLKSCVGWMYLQV